MLVELPTPGPGPGPGPGPRRRSRSRSRSRSPAPVDLLILGAGWTSTFLIPLLRREGIAHAATTRDGRGGTVPFTFDPGSRDPAPYAALPRAATVLVTFPLVGRGQSALLTEMYSATHRGGDDAGGPRYIQLGVTSIWTGPGWNDESSPYDAADPRAVAEDELLAVSSSGSGGGGGATVLSLAGLYGGARQPRHWVGRVARTKEELRRKGALHVIHGADVARAVVAVHRRFTPGRRWLLCDMHVYDWWELAQDWAGEVVRRASAATAATGAAAAASDASDAGDHGGGKGPRDVVSPREGEEGGEDVARQEELLAWVGELMVEEGVRALPRDPSTLGRTLDGRGFWKAMGIWPLQGRVK